LPTPSVSPVSPIRNGLIDLLRGWAVIAVVLLHIQIRVPFQGSDLAGWLSKRAYNFLFWSGQQGVIVFFVISGFLITTVSLQRWGSLDRIVPGDFYRFRVARLAPCLLLFVALHAALQWAGVAGFAPEPGSEGHLMLAVISALTFWLNWAEAMLGSYLPGGWDVLWSLSVEEAFYLGFPLLCLLLRKPGRIIAAMLLFVVLGPFSRTVLGNNEIWRDHAYLSGMGEIAMGCIAALLVHRSGYQGRRAGWLLTTGLALMAMVLYFRGWTFKLGLPALGLDMSVLGLGTALVLVACHSQPAWGRYADWLPGRVLQWFGRHSYEVYLSHMFVLLPLVALLPGNGLASVWIAPFYLLAVVLCGWVGHGLAQYFSMPLNKRLRQGGPGSRFKTTLATKEVGNG